MRSSPTSPVQPTPVQSAHVPQPKAAAQPAPAAKGPSKLKYTDIPVSSMRKTIAKRLTESKVRDVTLSTESSVLTLELI